MSCQCKVVISKEIEAYVSPSSLISFRHTVCGQDFKRTFVLCRCDTISDPKPVPGNLHFRGCPMYEAWVLARKQQIRDRLDRASDNLLLSPGSLWGGVKYLGSTKRGSRIRVKRGK